MTKPLPPIVHGPITPATPAAQVSAVVPGATVDLLVGGVSVGSETSSIGGTVWVTITTALSAGQSVTAKQSTLADGDSDESAQPVPVIDIPNPLPTPVFVSPLSNCMSGLRLDGLVPGATVLVFENNVVIGKSVATRTSDYVPIDPPAALNAGARLTTHQELALNGGLVASATALSLPLASVGREEQLPPPGVGQPLSACCTAINFFGATPSADMVVENEGTVTQWLNVGTAYNGWGAPPLREGKLVARQQFPRCGLHSAETVVPVGPPVQPGPPVILAAPCPALRRVHLSNLIPGAVVQLSTVVSDPAVPGQVTITPLGEALASSTSEDFDLPLGVEPTTEAGEAVRLTARQTLCGAASTNAAFVSFATPAGPFGPPAITPPLNDCTRRIVVTGAHPSSLLQPVDADSRLPVGDAVVAADTTVTLPLWFPATAGQRLLVRQTGCNADGASAAEKVLDLPNPLPSPTIDEPVRPQAASVSVTGCLVGARVHLLVNNTVRKSIDTLIAVSAIPTGDLNLAEGDALWAIQTLCASGSPIEGRPAVVRKGTMVLDVQPASVQRGTTAKVTVHARDNDTGTPIAGAQVLLNGAPAGTTGKPFTFAPALGQANPAGVVKAPVAYNDAPFSIVLTDPPPKPKGRLFLNVGPTVLIPNTLRLVSASWTVSTLWSPAQTFTATSANGVVTLPDPPPLPADQRVSVTLATIWEVAGYINGIPFSYQQFSGHMSPSPTLLAWNSNDLTAGWMVQWGIEYDGAGNPWVIVATVYQGAQ